MGNDPRVAGVISENPAYLMNSGTAGLPVALMGKVKCKVAGVIKKGDMLVTHENLKGVAKKSAKYIPFIGGMDFSPVIVILLLSFIRNLLIDYRLNL